MTNDLIFLDCEASSLSQHSYPIEIGWARLSASGEITVDSVLIKPAPSWDDWDPAAEKVHGILMGDLFAHGIAPPDAIQKIASALAGETVYSDSERDKLWCRRLFDLVGRGNPFRWRHVDALWIDYSQVISDIAYSVAEKLINQSGPVLHRAGPDAARLSVFFALARGIDREIKRAGSIDEREAGFARAEEAGRSMIERYSDLLVPKTVTQSGLEIARATVQSFDPAERARQKQASRDRDRERLEKGEVSAEDLRLENSFFGSLDVANFRIAAVGKKKFDPDP